MSSAPLEAAPQVPATAAGRGRSPRQRIWARFVGHRGARVGATVLCVLVALAVAAPWIAPGDPAAIGEGEDRFLTPPGPGAWLGTDDLGRDILTRVLYGGRISLTVGLVAVGLSSTIGASIGLLTGYYGGRFDNVVMRGMDLLMAFPGILLALLIIAILGRGLVNVMIAVGISDIPAFVRLVRGSVLGARENVYVEAARAVGLSDRGILLRHMLPNVFAPLLVVSTLEVGNAILVASSLSFLGLGAQPPSPEWGAMLAAGREYMRTAWWLTVFPGLAIAFTVLAVNLLGDGLRDAIDPKLSRV